MSRIPLDGEDGLYTIIGSLLSNNEQQFCPIMLEIVNKDILKKENPDVVEDKDYMRYLLQVWTNKGVMIFERRMK